MKARPTRDIFLAVAFGVLLLSLAAAGPRADRRWPEQVPVTAASGEQTGQTPARTQAPSPRPPAQQNRLIPGPEPKRDLAASLRVIRPMLRTNPERAIEMLRVLEGDYPGNPQVLDLLGEAYTTVGMPDSAVSVYRRSLRAHPTDVRAGAALGTILIQEDRGEEGRAVFKTLLDNTKHAVNTYRNIGSALARAGYYDQALRIYMEGRAVNDGNYVLTLDIGHLQKTMGNFESALDEYVGMIETAPKHFRLARDRILDLMRDPRAVPDSLLTRLAAVADADTPYRPAVMNVLALAYLEHGMIENALEAALEAETIGASDGKILFDLAEQTINEYRRQAFDRRTKLFDLALRALEAYIDGHPESPQVARAKLMLIDLLVDVAEGRVEPYPGLVLGTATEKAIEALDWVIETFPNTDHMEEAYLKKGDVVFRLKKQPEEAIKIYRLGLSQARFYPTAFAERLGRLFLIVGDYEQAGTYFEQLVRDPSQELREAGIFYTGLLLSVKGRYEAARDTLVSLAEGNPASQFTNDAIELAWVIEEGLQGKKEVLDHYIGGLRSEVADDTTAAISDYRAIIAYAAETPLRARALFRIGELYQGAGIPDKAIETFEMFVRDYPADTRVPDAHRRIGQVYERSLDDVEMALAKYEDILLSYPHYIFLDDVRADVVRLREQVGAQP